MMRQQLEISSQLDNLNGAGDVQVDSFEQSSTQTNNCQLFDNCINVAGNTLAIARRRQ